MDYLPSRYKDLSEQLTSWWRAQADFKTKKALADSLKVHPDTLGDYFSGKRFPKGGIASRLWELTKIVCLKPCMDGDPSSGISSKDDYRSGSSESVKKGERYGERSVVISLQRASCPFCGQVVKEFHDCIHCGQHFVWANVPLEQHVNFQ